MNSSYCNLREFAKYLALPPEIHNTCVISRFSFSPVNIPTLFPGFPLPIKVWHFFVPNSIALTLMIKK